MTTKITKELTPEEKRLAANGFSLRRNGTIEQMYDIAMAFITDKGSIPECETMGIDEGYIYTFKKHGLIDYPYGLSIYMPKNKTKNNTTTGEKILDVLTFEPGEISLYRGRDRGLEHQRVLIEAKTKMNIGMASRSKFNRAISHIFAPKYFNLVNAAQKRIDNKLELRDNTEIIAQFIQKCPNR